MHLAALGGEVVDVLLHLALVLAAVAHLTLDQLLAILAAADGGDPVAEPSGQNLDCVGGVFGAVRDRVRAAFLRPWPRNGGRWATPP